MPDLLKEASSLLSREAARIPVQRSSALRSGDLRSSDLRSGNADVVGPRAAGPAIAREQEASAFRCQLQEIIDSLRRLQPPPLAPAEQERMATRAPAAQGSSGWPHRTSAMGGEARDQLPLLHSAGLVAPGSSAHFVVRVANGGSLAYPVALGSTNLISGTGFEISSVHVTATPRMQELAPYSEATFAVAVAVPQQAAPGTYVGLLRALGICDFQTALSLAVA